MIQNHNLALSFYSGAGIGILFGIIMGLSVSPTVAIVLGALTAILAAILGLNDLSFSNAKAVRIGSFGFACVLGILAGLYIRTHDTLSPSSEVLMAEYQRLGFSDEQAREFIAIKAGLVTQVRVINATPTVDENIDDSNTPQPTPVNTMIVAPTVNPSSSVLFSGSSDNADCKMLKKIELGSLEIPALEYYYFELVKGRFKPLYAEVNKSIEERDQKKVLLLGHQMLCETPYTEGIKADCNVLNAIHAPEGISASLANTALQSDFWQTLQEETRLSGIHVTQEDQAVLIIKDVLCSSVKN
jgi:hypothetical protein